MVKANESRILSWADAAKFSGNNDPQLLRSSHNAVKFDSKQFVIY
jgi:hypothetical protein